MAQKSKLMEDLELRCREKESTNIWDAILTLATWKFLMLDLPQCQLGWGPINEARDGIAFFMYQRNSCRGRALSRTCIANLCSFLTKEPEHTAATKIDI